MDGTAFDWHHYGGPLALFRLCRFVRLEILKDQPTPRKVVPIPGSAIYQQGDLILKKVDEIPSEAVPVAVEKVPNGGVPLGHGHVISPQTKTRRPLDIAAQQRLATNAQEAARR